MSFQFNGYKKKFLLLSFIALLQPVYATGKQHYINLLKQMFDKMVVQKNSHLISYYYDRNFILHSNGKTMQYPEFAKFHEDIYKTPIQYSVRYDESTLIEEANKIGGRMFITTKTPNEPSHEIEVIFVGEYKGEKLYRLSELTYPDWSKLKTFNQPSRDS